MEQQKQNFFDWHQHAVDAVEHLDAGRAIQSLQLMEQVVLAMPVEAQKLDLKEYLEDLRVDLRYTALPSLSIEEVGSILKSEVVSFLRRGFSLDERLETRRAYTIYGEHENERVVLQKSILGNKEKVGSKTIGEWLMQFDKAFDPLKRSESSVLDFLRQIFQRETLSEFDQSILRLVLLAYERWIAVGRLTAIDVAYLEQHPELVNAGASNTETSAGPYASAAANRVYQENRGVTGKPGRGVLKLPLLKALADYPRLGEQALTTEKIRIKGQPEPVRPTLSNWIRYYRDELGIGFHDQVTRGKFLFQSENGKRLGNEERERINLVLKSLEEEFPLDIDTDRGGIVFPVRTQASPVSSAFPRRDPASLLQTRPAKLYQGTPSVAPAPIQTPAQTPTQAPAPPTLPVSPVKSFLSGTFGKTKNVAGDTLHFSTGHVLSSEKPTPQVTPVPAPQPVSVPTPRPVVLNPSQSINMASINRNPTGFLPRSPYSIRPLRLRDDKTNLETENR